MHMYAHHAHIHTKEEEEEEDWEAVASGNADYRGDIIPQTSRSCLPEENFYNGT